MTLRCEPLARPHLAELAALFERAGSGCHCSYWHFPGDKNAWLERLSSDPSQNQQCFAERASTGALEGLVARAGERAVGWMKLSPARSVPKLYAQRPYRGLPGLASDRDEVLTIGCFLIDPEWRRRGVATALLDQGILTARASGAHAIEAFPRRAEIVHDEEAWTGPFELFRRRGFVVVHEQAQYPVLRLLL